jgi:hypothetical protein
MAVDLGDIFDARGCETEGLDGPFEISIPLAPSQGTSFSQCRFYISRQFGAINTIDLDDGDASLLEIRDFITKSKAKLLSLDGLRDIISWETPSKNGYGASQHSFHCPESACVVNQIRHTGFLGEPNCIFRLLYSHWLGARNVSNHDGRSNVARSKRLNPSILSEYETLQTFSKILNLSSNQFHRGHTISFRSGSPWTKTSNPTSSWNLIIS